MLLTPPPRPRGSFCVSALAGTGATSVGPGVGMGDPEAGGERLVSLRPASGALHSPHVKPHCLLIVPIRVG